MPTLVSWLKLRPLGANYLPTSSGCGADGSAAAAAAGCSPRPHADPANSPPSAPCVEGDAVQAGGLPWLLLPPEPGPLARAGGSADGPLVAAGVAPRPCCCAPLLLSPAGNCSCAASTPSNWRAASAATRRLWKREACRAAAPCVQRELWLHAVVHRERHGRQSPQAESMAGTEHQSLRRHASEPTHWWLGGCVHQLVEPRHQLPSCRPGSWVAVQAFHQQRIHLL